MVYSQMTTRIYFGNAAIGTSILISLSHSLVFGMSQYLAYPYPQLLPSLFAQSRFHGCDLGV